MASFVKAIQEWQKAHGRKQLPWQGTKNPYKVWLSEIMLQQTQVNTVIPYYLRFLKRFPTVTALAKAKQEDVMPYWAGLGYYARARNLHKCAQIIEQTYQGHFPISAEQLNALPGIGISTANAIAAFCFDANTPIMDGNVKRVFTRYYGIAGYDRKTEKKLWSIAYDHIKHEKNIGQYNQGLMDLGSLICTRQQAKCHACPLQQHCFAFTHQQQLLFPTKKPKKVIPHKETFMLILNVGAKVWLQQRPQEGIWGGLLSLPEISDKASLEQWLTTQPDAIIERMASLEHVFSHYRLSIHPILVTFMSSLKSRPLFKNGKWYRVDSYPSLALPKPVYKILQNLAKQMD